MKTTKNAAKNWLQYLHVQLVKTQITVHWLAFSSAILLRALPALNHVICPSFMEWLSSIVSEPPSAWVILH